MKSGESSTTAPRSSLFPAGAKGRPITTGDGPENNPQQGKGRQFAHSGSGLKELR